TSYYQALTAASGDSRQAALAKVFLGIGHLMHLVEDAGVPSHSRNTCHAGYKVCANSPFEEFVLSRKQWESDCGCACSVPDTDFIGLAPLVPPDSVFSSAFGSDLTPAVGLIDSRKYFAATPKDAAVTLDPGIGIAEYSNAGFANDPQHQVFRQKDDAGN